jgi:hypothetical protein
MFNGRIVGEQTGPTRFAGANLEIALEQARTLGEGEETLVADPRGNLSPAQIVERRLTALLATGRPRGFIDAVGRLADAQRARRVAGALLIQGGRPPLPDEPDKEEGR